MNFDKNRLRLYAVTDRSWLRGQTLEQQVEAALQGGVTCVQLREKQLDREEFIHLGRRMAELCRRYGVPLLINDDLEIALACGADGVHVGQDDLPVEEVRRRAGDKLIVGVSAHNPEEARRAYEPESYKAAQALIDKCGFSIKDMGNANIGGVKQVSEKVNRIGVSKLAEEIGIGAPTLADIVKELEKPGRDPRDELPPPLMRSGDIMELKDLKPGMELMGTVRNVIDFGAFVDIGVHEEIGRAHV